MFRERICDPNMVKHLNSDIISEKLGISPQYARKLLRDGKIKSKKIDNILYTTEEDLIDFLRNSDIIINPPDRIRKSSDIPKITALSFFSGAMGLDIGMTNAGISPLLACEINKEARATIIENNEDIGLIGDIWQCSKEQIYKYANLPDNHKIDVIFGGPPCQAFSTAGNRKGFEDARGDVFLKYLDIIDELKPTYAVIENVRGLQTTEAILEETNGLAVKGGVLHYVTKKLQSSGYSVSFELYNAANFGAPQKRERFVIIAKYGSQKVPYLTPTHSESNEYNLPKWVTLGEVIHDIQNKPMNYLEIPPNRKEWYKKIPEGGNWKSLSLEDQKLAMGKKFYMPGGKTGFFRRLSFNQPSPTLVTVPTMPATDLIHPTQLRPLSIEEYARIQGFPDNWRFRGKLGEIYRQIGNAVPIKLGEAIGKTIINDIEGISEPIYPNFKYSRYKYTSDIDFPIYYENHLKDALTKANLKSEQLSLPI
jgi:DNA (cytosine-5-)-methyltransferase